MTHTVPRMRCQQCVERLKTPVGSTCQTSYQVTCFSSFVLPSSNLTSRQETPHCVMCPHKCCYRSDLRTSIRYRPIACVAVISQKYQSVVGGSPLTQENHLVVVSGVTGTHSNANAAYKYTSTSRLF